MQKISLESASEQLWAITISRQQVLPQSRTSSLRPLKGNEDAGYESGAASLTHAQTLPLAVVDYYQCCVLIG